MNISGKVLKANIVRGRDAYELELRVSLRDGKANVYAATSGYVGKLATVALVDVPPAFWDANPGEELPKPSPATFAAPPIEEPAPEKHEKSPKAKEVLGGDFVIAQPAPLPPVDEVMTSAAPKKSTKKKEEE